MANRYWVGGTGSWTSSSTTNWSATSGGAGGASAPTSADDVFFNANSNIGTGAFTCTMAGGVCRDVTISGLDGVMTLAGTSTWLISGSLTFPATNFNRTYTGTTQFNATTTGKTITTNGVSLRNITFSGVGGAWTLGSALTCATGSGAGATIVLTAGTFDTGGYAVTIDGAFSSSNTNTRVINLNNSLVTIGPRSGAPWVLTTSTNATLNAGTSTIDLTTTNSTFSGGGLTYNNLLFSSTTGSNLTNTIEQANTFNNLTFNPLAGADVHNLSLAADQTINGTLTIAGVNGTGRRFVRSSVFGTQRTLTCNAVSLTDVDFRNITIAGVASPASGTRLGDAAYNTGITFTTPKTVYWNLVGGGNWNATAWATSSGGAVVDTNFPLPQDTAIIEDTGLNTSATITLNLAYKFSSIDASTRTNAWSLIINQNSEIYGNFAVNTAVSFIGTSRSLNFINDSIKTINSGGKTFNIHSITINGVGGGLQLTGSNFTIQNSFGTNLTAGTLDLNNLIFSTPLFAATSNTFAKNITFNGGRLSITTNGSFTGRATDFTTTAGTGNGVISMDRTSSTQTFAGNGAVYNCDLNLGGAGTLTISGSNTFDDITNSVQPATILFTAGTTQTVNNFSLSGTSGNLITIDSTTASQFTLSKSSGTVAVSYLDVRDSNATGGATWNAFTGDGNVNGGNNTGWNFSGVNVFITGVSGTGDVGTVSVEEGVGVFVSGVAGTGDVGVVSIQGTADIVVSGVAGTGNVGTVSITGTSSLTLTGVAGTGDVGTVSVEEGVGVSVTGLQATAFVGTVVLFSGTIVFPVGVQALCLIGNVTVWGPVDDSDTANWVPVNDSNGASWTPVNDSNGASWTPVPN